MYHSNLKTMLPILISPAIDASTPSFFCRDNALKKAAVSLMLWCFFGVFALATPQAKAADWAIIDGDAKKVPLLEVDMASITQVANVAKAWVRISYPKPQMATLMENTQKKAYRSVIYRIILDCLNARYVYSGSLLYSQPQAQGVLLARNQNNEREAMSNMRDIIPQSKAANIFHYTCRLPGA